MARNEARDRQRATVSPPATAANFASLVQAAILQTVSFRGAVIELCAIWPGSMPRKTETLKTVDEIAEFFAAFPGLGIPSLELLDQPFDP